MKSSDRIYSAFKSDSFVFPVFINSVLMVAWGLWVLSPVEVFSSASAFDGLSALASEFAWGALFVVVGIIQGRTVLRLDYRGVASVSLIAGYLWLIVAISFGYADPANTGWIVYAFLALFEGWTHTISKHVANDLH